MNIKHLSLLVTSIIWITGCTRHTYQSSIKRVGSLGKEYSTFQTPKDPKKTVENFKPEPNGIITLHQALSAALMRNPDLAVFSWEIGAREASLIQAGLLPNPEIEFEVEEEESTLVLSQLIELGRKRVKRIREAELEKELADWDFETKRLDVFAETTERFLDVLITQEQLKLANEFVRISKQVLDSASLQVQAGKVPPLEETRAKVAFSRSKIQSDRFKRNLKVSRKRLAAIWGSTAPSFHEVAGKLDLAESIPSFEEVEHLIEKNPDIARWIVELEQQQIALEIEKANRISDLTISGGLQREKESGDNSMVVAVGVPLTIFDRNQGGILEAEYNLAKAEKERRAMEIRIHTDLTEVYETLSSAYAESKSLKEDVLPAAELAFNAASEGFQQGKFGFLDVLDAQRTLFDVRGQYIEALGAYHKAVVDLERLIGVDLASVRHTLKEEYKENENEK